MKRVNSHLTNRNVTIIKLALITFLLAFTYSFAFANTKSESGEKNTNSLRIIYSGGLKGNIKPCG